jgi:hypothetical protein
MRGMQRASRGVPRWKNVFGSSALRKEIIVRCYHMHVFYGIIVYKRTAHCTGLKVPKCEIFDRSDLHDFYTMKPFWVADFEAKILTCYFNFLRELGII